MEWPYYFEIKYTVLQNNSKCSVIILLFKCVCVEIIYLMRFYILVFIVDDLYDYDII